MLNRHHLVQFLVTDLKQNKRNNKKKSGRYRVIKT